MLEEITTGTWQPSILPVVSVRQEQNSGKGENLIHQGNGKEKERKPTIHNNQQSALLKLKQDEKFWDLISTSQQKPRTDDNNNMICINFHCRGFCTHNCRMKETHRYLSASEYNSLKVWLKEARRDTRNRDYREESSNEEGRTIKRRNNTNKNGQSQENWQG